MSPAAPRLAQTRPLRAFARDERGGILVFWGLFLAVGFGFVALTFDIGRVANTQSELQSFADQVALAAAGELDGRSDAIIRATAAADGLITRRQTFGDGDGEMGGAGDFAIEFLRSLPADDRDAISDANRTTNPALARFVRVTVNRRTVQTPFAAVNATLIGRAGANAQSQVGAGATAGVSGWACDITPLFFCVPSADWRGDANVGQQIRLRTGGQGSLWGPGNFGFLDPASLPVDDAGPCAGLNGAPLYRCLVGAESAITQCVQTDGGIDTLTGQRQGLVRAFNTRFDIYDGPMNSMRNNDAYRPAPNVVSDMWSGSGGQGGGQGGGQTSADPPSLPRDGCIESGTCRFGSNDWDRYSSDSYLALYHDDQWPLPDDPNADDRPTRDVVTRYDIYRAEIDAARARGNDDWPLTADGYEGVGRPGNHSAAKTAADRALLNPARRTIIAAAVDCDNTDMSGKSNVVPLEYVRIFMTEPVMEMGGDDKGDILVEVVESAGGLGSGATSGVFRELVQLFR
jgi:hypothetical protein